jgi:metal-responsive CopG/Arc/MetJ family transcriptional regulator
MKIAVSIPDDVFAEAESLAQRLNTSRSELYSRALTEFVGHHAPERVTEQMNQVVSAIGEGEPDVFRAAAARRVFKRVDW